MAEIENITHGSSMWDATVNNNFNELDARTTANGGGIESHLVNGGLTWLNGAHAETQSFKYYQLKDCKRVVINASWVILEGHNNNGLRIATVPEGLRPKYVISQAMSDCWTAMIHPEGDIVVWCSDPTRINQEIPTGSIALYFEYETA